MARRLPVLLLLTLLGTAGCTTVAPSAVPDDDRPSHAPATSPLPAASVRGSAASSPGRSGEDAEKHDDGRRRAGDRRRGDDPRRDHDDRREKKAEVHHDAPSRPPAKEPTRGHPEAVRPGAPVREPAAPPVPHPEHRLRPPADRPADPEGAKPPASGGGAGMKSLCDQADRVTDPTVASLCHRAYG